MNKIHQDKVTDFLDKLDIDSLAKSTRFRIRKPKKILAYDFLLSFFLTLGSNKFTLRKWAQKLTTITKKVVSFQSIAKKLDSRQLVFARSVFAKSIKQFVLDGKRSKITNGLLLKFNRVFLEDSSCVKMSSALYNHFSGSTNQHNKTAIGRIQFCFDLKSNNVESVALNTYSQNDPTYADKILEKLVPNDLIIRDLGYFITSVFQEIIEKKAFFISRLKLGVTIFDANGEEEFYLEKQLKELDRLGIRSFDKNLRITATEKLKVRIVAMKLTPSQVAKRRRHAKKSRHKDSKISKKAMYLMSWNIFITNVEDKVLTVKEIYELYALRWQVELIFKNWKSYFKIDQLMSSCVGANPAKPEMLMYLTLTFWVLVYIPKLMCYHQLILKKHGRHLSPNKFASFMLDNLKEYFFEKKTEKEIIEILVNFCCYGKRKDRVNNYEKLYGFFT